MCMKKITAQKEININTVSSTKMLVWGSLVCFLVVGYLLCDPGFYTQVTGKSTRHVVMQTSSKGGKLNTGVSVHYKFEVGNTAYDGNDSIWFSADTRLDANKLAGAYQKSHAVGSSVDVAFLKIKPTYNFFYTKLFNKVPPMLFTSLFFWGVFMAIFFVFLGAKKAIYSQWKGNWQ